MTEEQKQMLIDFNNSAIIGFEARQIYAELSRAEEMQLESLRIALAALTAQPVNIKNSDFESALTLLNDVLDDCGDSERGLLLALSRMGIEVQE